jgi:hypothetical protein
MFGREPVAITAAIRAIILLATAFGLQWSAEQIAATMVAVEAVLALLTRQSVTPNQTATEKIQETARTGVAQSLKGFVIVVLLGGSVLIMGCSASLKRNVVTGYQASAIGIEAIYNVETEVFKAGVLPALTPNKQDQILGVIDKMIAIQERAGLAIIAWTPGAPVPQDVDGWFKAAGEMLPQIEAIVPEVGSHLRKAQAVIVWAKALIDIAKLFRIQIPTNVSALALAEAQ